MWIRARRSNVPLHVRKKHKQRCSHGDVIVLEDEMEKYKKMFPNTEVRSKARISTWSQSQSHASKNQETRCDICLFGRTRKRSTVTLTTGCVTGAQPVGQKPIVCITSTAAHVVLYTKQTWNERVTSFRRPMLRLNRQCSQYVSHLKRPFVFSFSFAFVAATMRRAP